MTSLESSVKFLCIARFAKLFLPAVVLALLLCISALAGDPSANVKDIPSFVKCLNDNVKKGDQANVADAVMCIPKGCTMTLTMSQASAQAACNLGGCQLPRVILDCPGPKPDLRFRPSFLLCPIDSNQEGEHPFGTDRIEIGVDVTPVEGDTGNMMMADLDIPPNKPYNPVDPNKITSTVGNDKGCNVCHNDKTPANAKQGDPVLSEAIHPFSTSCAGQGVDVSQYVIDTDDPDYEDKVKPGDVKVGGVPVEAQGIADVCDCINNHRDEISAAANNLDDVKANFPDLKKPEKALNPALDPGILHELCTNLQNYHDSRACGTATGRSGTVLPCAGVEGGGKFLEDPPVDDSVSTLVFAISGQAESSGGGTSTTYSFVNTSGSISAFDYKSRNQIASVQVTSLTATSFTSGDLQISGMGSAVVNGKNQNVVFNFDRVGGVTSFSIENAKTLTPLAAGVEEPGRAGIKLSVSP